MRSVLLALALAASALPAEARVWITAVANDRGLGSEMPLRFAEADARAVAAELALLHPDRDQKIEVLTDVQADDVRDALARLEAQATGDDTVVFFLTGHGDRRGAHLAGKILPWTEIDAGLQRIAARVIVAIIDTCQSGAFLSPKGFVRGGAITVKLEPRGPQGRWYLTSSGADELSHESAQLGGSPFAHHLMSGLRGAADHDGDGQITVAELYRHTHGRTLASTLDAPRGPQRPQQSSQLRGAGEVVLATSAALSARLFGSSVRPCWVLDVEEERVLAELTSPRAIALKPGFYVVKCTTSEGLVARAELALATRRNADDLEYVIEPAAPTLAKGPDEELHAQLSMSPALLLGSASSGKTRPGLTMGLSVDRGPFTFPVQAVLQNIGDELDVTILAGVAYRLPWWQAGRVDLGVELGGGVGPGREFAAFGQFVRWQIGIVGPIRLISRADIITAWSPATSAVTLDGVLSLGVALPILGSPGNSPDEKE